ncbi:MAG: hypothetical protein ACOYOS_04785 [Syntrophales bacterium]
MITRISEKARFDTIAENVFNLQDTMSRVSDQLTTLKKINRPSDDPAGATMALNLRSAGASIQQYKENIIGGETWLKVTGLNLNSIKDLLTLAEGVAQDAQGGSTSDRSAAANSLESVSGQILSFANSKLNGKYMFSGSNTDTAPFPDSTSAYAGDSESLLINIGQNSSTAAYNIPGNAVFPASGGKVTVFEKLDALVAVLRADSTDSQVSTAIAAFKTASQDVKTRTQDNITKTAAMLSNLEFTDNHLTFLKARVEKMISTNEDADVSKLAMEFQMQALSLNASYTVAGKMNESSLLNFLR